MKAAIYIRMSTADQENSPERQRGQILPYCSTKKYEVVGVYVDLSMRGNDDSRPQFQKLLRDAKDRKFDVVVVDEQSRLTRNDPVDFIASVVSPLRNANVVIDTVAKGVLDWNDLGQFIVGAVTQHASAAEIVTLSRRVVTEIARKATNADIVCGKAPYGYRKVWRNQAGEVVWTGNRNWSKRPDGVKPTLIVHEPEAEVVRFIFNAYMIEDRSLCDITRSLYSMGHRSPNDKDYWPRSCIRNLLKNRVYVGDFVFNRVSVGGAHRLGFVGEGQNRHGVAVPKPSASKGKVVKNAVEDWVVVEDAYPALVSRELFDRTQRALSGNQKRCAPLASKNEYACSGLLSCAKCGSGMVGDREGDTKFYLCGGYASHGVKKCNPYRIREEDAIGLVIQEIAANYLDPDRLALIRAEAKREKEKRSAGEELRGLRKLVKELDAKINRGSENLLLLDADRVPAAQTQLRKWEAERKELRTRIENLEHSDPVQDVEARVAQMELGLKLLQTARAVGDLVAFRKAARACIQRIELRYRSEQKAVRQRHWLEGGVCHLTTGEVFEFKVRERKG